MSLVPLLACWGATLALSTAPDALARPHAGWRRPWRAWSLLWVVTTLLFLLLFSAFARPIFAGGVTLGLIGLMAGVSNAKHASLREPFVFTDLSLFAQLFAHPRLYLPFLSRGAVVAFVAGVAILISAVLIEPAASRLSRPGLLPTLLALGASCALCVVLAKGMPLTLRVNDDVRTHGFTATFIAYLVNGWRPATFARVAEALASGPHATGHARGSHPDVVVIQSESFFDARALHPSIKPSLLRHFDAARVQSTQFGDLTVPAWGANTMRTEFALLTGLDEAALGYGRFYPYAFVRRAAASLASWFSRGGYRTTALHPYHGDFFGRDRVFPLLGFSAFEGIEHFGDAPRAGAYVSDAALADAIVTRLRSAEAQDTSTPQFIFAMSMENHGPLHLETVVPGESAAWHALGDDAQWHDLTAYLRHLQSADDMIGRLLAYLRTRRRETVLCFYGDHVPALRHVFDALGHAPSRSQYFIWRNFGDVDATQASLDVAQLGMAVRRALRAGRRQMAAGL